MNEQTNPQGELNEQRSYAARGMPERDPQTQRRLERVLGKDAPTEHGPGLTQLPPDTLHEMGKIISDNKDLAAAARELPMRMDQLAGDQKTLTATLGQISQVLGQICQKIGLNQAPDPASTTDLPRAHPSVLSGKKGKRTHVGAAAVESSEEGDELPPPEN